MDLAALCKEVLRVLRVMQAVAQVVAGVITEEEQDGTEMTLLATLVAVVVLDLLTPPLSWMEFLREHLPMCLETQIVLTAQTMQVKKHMEVKQYLFTHHTFL